VYQPQHSARTSATPATTLFHHPPKSPACHSQLPSSPAPSRPPPALCRAQAISPNESYALAAPMLYESKADGSLAAHATQTNLRLVRDNSPQVTIPAVPRVTVVRPTAPSWHASYTRSVRPRSAPRLGPRPCTCTPMHAACTLVSSSSPPAVPLLPFLLAHGLNADTRDASRTSGAEWPGCRRDADDTPVIKSLMLLSPCPPPPRGHDSAPLDLNRPPSLPRRA
jgi:hypothetical protein